MTKEQRVRAYASHLGLMTRGARGGPYTLVEKYRGKRKIGTYRSIASLEHAIERYGDRELRRLSRKRA